AGLGVFVEGDGDRDLVPGAEEQGSRFGLEDALAVIGFEDAPAREAAAGEFEGGSPDPVEGDGVGAPAEPRVVGVGRGGCGAAGEAAPEAAKQQAHGASSW